MRGRPVCPTGQKKNSVGATGGSAPLFYKERLGTGSPPHPTRLRRPTFPPRGRLWGVETQRVGNFLSQKCFPAYFPSKNASQISLSIPEEIAPQPYQRQRSPKRASGSKRAINPGSRGLPLVFFPPTFFKESRAPPPESAGDSRRRVHPATVPTELLPMTEGPGPLSPHFSGEMGTPAGQAGPPGRCAPRAASERPTQRVRTTDGPTCGLLRSPESPLCLPRSPSWHTGPNTRS